MTIDEVFAEIHKLSVRETLRRFQPKFTVVVVSPKGTVVAVENHKTVPDFSEIGELIRNNKGCGAFVASAEMYPTVEELKERVLSMAETLKKRKCGGSNSAAQKGLVGTTYYGRRKGS